MKRILITLFILLIASHYFYSTYAQNKDEKNKEKKMIIKIEKEENGIITKVDTTIVLKEGEDPSKILEKYGVKGDEGTTHTKTFKIKIDDNDTSDVSKEKKMLWVTVTDDNDSLKNCVNQESMVFYVGDDEGDEMHMTNSDVMIMRHPRGNRMFHIKESKKMHGGDSMIIEKHIMMDDDMDMGHNKVFRYKFDNNNDIIQSDIQGPMFMGDMHDNSDSTIVIVKTYKDGKEISDTKRVIRTDKKEKRVMIKVLDAEKADLGILKLKENYKKLEVKDFNIMVNDNKIKIDFELSAKDNIGIKMIDKTGKVIFTEDLKQFQGKYSKEIEAIKGEIFIQINQGSKYFVQKVILDFN